MTDGEVNGRVDNAVETIQPHEILQKGLSDQDSGSEKALGRELFLRRVGFWLALIVLGIIPLTPLEGKWPIGKQFDSIPATKRS